MSDIRRDWLVWRQCASAEEVFSLPEGTLVRAHVYHHSHGPTDEPIFDKVEPIQFPVRSDGVKEVITKHADVYYPRERWQMDEGKTVGRFVYDDDEGGHDELVLFVLQEDIAWLAERLATTQQLAIAYSECAEEARGYLSALYQTQDARNKAAYPIHGVQTWRDMELEVNRWRQGFLEQKAKATMMKTLFEEIQEGTLAWLTLPERLCELWEATPRNERPRG